MCSLCLMFFRFLCLWLMLQVYCGPFPAGFGLYLELKSLFLERVILESLACEDSCSCFWSGFYFLPCCVCCVVPICELDVGSLTTPKHRHTILSDFLHNQMIFFFFFLNSLWYFPDWWTYCDIKTSSFTYSANLRPGPLCSLNSNVIST